MSEITGRLSTALADRYRIERHLGEGGMATVYLANDLKHDRKVALKVLKPELAAVIGAERFVQEIKVTANLQHPNILALYDSGEADSFLYYVMPYVQGESLRNKLDREKQLPVDESVMITSAVAGALDYAHRHDVIHRDIKPENILLHDGQALVADFGIALAISSAAGNRLTETGLSIGTPHYMSPEQASADRELDGRSDVYSLGATVYEMLVGQPPFTGASAQAIVAKILTEDPTLVTAERRTVPSHVEAAIHSALAKLPADRFPSAAAFRDALEDPAFRGSTGLASLTTHAVGLPASLTMRHVSVAGIVIGLIGLAIGFLVRGPGSPSESEITRFTVELPGLTLQSLPALSSDGRRLAYLASADTGLGTFLFSRRLDRFDADVVVQTLGGGVSWNVAPFFSPNGEWIAYLTGQGLEKVRAGGEGTPVPIETDRDAGQALGGSWGADERIVFTPDVGLGLMSVSVNGGQTETLTELDHAAGEVAHAWPQILPSGDGIVFSIHKPDGWTTAVYSVEHGQWTQLFPAAAPVRYVSSGHLIYAQRGTLYAVPFDQETLRVTGAPILLIPRLQESRRFGGAEVIPFSVSLEGSLVYQVRHASAAPPLTFLHRDGTLERTLDGTERERFPDHARSPRISPDGRFVAYSDGFETWMYDLNRGTTEPVLTDAPNYHPQWHPQGDRLLLSWYGSGASNLYLHSLDDNRTSGPILEREYRQYASSWSPDGKYVAYVEEHPTTGADIWTFEVASGDATSWLATEFTETVPRFSPDGRWLAYQSDRAGEQQVYVQRFPTAGRTINVSLDGGEDPVWAKDGSELFFKRGDEFLVVAVPADPATGFGAPRTLFTFPASARGSRSYDVTADGQRFLVDPRAQDIVDRLFVVRNGLREFMESGVLKRD